MKQTTQGYSVSGYQTEWGAATRQRTENQDSPPYKMVVVVFAAAMLGGAYVSATLQSIALGWMAGVGILGALGAVIHRWCTGPDALERRLNARARARHNAVARCGINFDLKQQRSGGFRSRNSATREWTSKSASRHHQQWTTTALAGWSQDSMRPGIHEECRTQRG